MIKVIRVTKTKVFSVVFMIFVAVSDLAFAQQSHLVDRWGQGEGDKNSYQAIIDRYDDCVVTTGGVGVCGGSTAVDDAPIILDEASFDTGSMVLKPVAIDKLRTNLANYKKAKSVKIVGHTDRMGGSADNQILSKKRAISVRMYLRNHGVTAPIKAIGMGDREPRASNDSALGRAKNRRVVITTSK